MEVVTRTVVQFLALVFCSCFLAGPGSHAHQMHEKWECDHDHTDFLHDITYRVHLGSDHHHVRKRALDQPFRVFVHYDSTVEENLTPDAVTRLNNTINKLTEFLEETLTVRPLGEPILFDRRCGGISGSFFIQTDDDSVRTCVHQCVETTCGSTGIVIPDSHLKGCNQCNGNGFGNCETVALDGTGVDAEYVLYVSAVTTSTCPSSQNPNSNLLGFGGACQMEDEFDRPIGGFVNFCPDSVNDIEDDDYLFAVAKHEVLHGLGFSAGLYPFWRDEAGEPRTPRNSNGFPPIVNGQYAASTSTIQQVTYTDWRTRSGSVFHTVTMLVTPRVTEEARKHFNCSTLQGLELENGGGSGTATSHWEQRLLEYEAMTGIITSNPVFSRMTFALLEDSGWYGVNYDNAENLLWGRGLGCDFSSGSCGGYIQARISQGESVSPFCNEFDGNSASGCTLRRDAISSCNLVQFSSSLPTEYQYFDSTTTVGATSITVFSRVGGNSQLSDFCPIQQGFSNTVCDDPTFGKGTGTNNIFAQTFGEGSRCIFTSGQWTVRQVGSLSSFFSTSSGAGCYQYGCSNGQVTVFVFGQPYLCSFAGEQISVDVTHEGFIYTGTIICPSCLEICYDDFENCPEAATLFGVSTTTITEPTSTSVSTITSSIAPSSSSTTTTTTTSSTAPSSSSPAPSSSSTTTTSTAPSSTSTTTTTTSSTAPSSSTTTTITTSSTSPSSSSTTAPSTSTSTTTSSIVPSSSSSSTTSSSIAPSTTTSSTTPTTSSSSTTTRGSSSSIAPSTTSSSTAPIISSSSNAPSISSSSTAPSISSSTITPSISSSSTAPSTTSSSIAPSISSSSIAPSTTSSSIAPSISSSSIAPSSSSIAPSSSSIAPSSSSIAPSSSSSIAPSISSSSIAPSISSSSIAPSISSSSIALSISSSSIALSISSSSIASSSSSIAPSSSSIAPSISSSSIAPSISSSSIAPSISSSSIAPSIRSSSIAPSIRSSSSILRSSVVRSEDVPEPTSEVLEGSGSGFGNETTNGTMTTDGSVALFSFWLVGLTVLLHTIIVTLMGGFLV